MTKAPEIETEWVRVEDANRRLLCELSLVSGCIRIRREELTTEVNLAQEREKHLRARLFPVDSGPRRD